MNLLSQGKGKRLQSGAKVCVGLGGTFLMLSGLVYAGPVKKTVLVPQRVVANPIVETDSVDPNVILSLRRVFIADVKDNVDGAYVSVAAQSLGENLGAYPQFSKSSKEEDADFQVRLVIDKDAKRVGMKMEFSLTSSQEVFALQEIRLAPDADEFQLREGVKKLFRSCVKKVPFMGQVTGRDKDQITLDMGSAQGLKQGDEVSLARISQIRRHPYLKQILDVQMQPVGTAKISQIEEGVSFAEIQQEFTGETLKRLHKVVALVQRGRPEETLESPKDSGKDPDYLNEYVLGEKVEGTTPHLGFLSLGIGLGSLSNTTTTSGKTLSGSAFSPSFQLDGEIWFTSAFFADLTLNGGMASYSHQGGSSTADSGVSTTWRSFGFNGGYRYRFSESVYGPYVYAKAGYFNFSWAAPQMSADLLAERTYGGLNLAIGGSLPFGYSPYGAIVDLSFLLFPGFSEKEDLILGKDTNALVVRFRGGLYYYWTQRIATRLMVDFQSYAAEQEEGKGNATTNQKVIGVIPSIQFFF